MTGPDNIESISDDDGTRRSSTIDFLCFFGGLIETHSHSTSAKRKQNTRCIIVSSWVFDRADVESTAERVAVNGFTTALNATR